MNSPEHTLPRIARRIIAICLLLSSIPAASQISTKVASISPSSAMPHVPLTLSVALLQGETIEKVFLVYRSFGSSDYERVEMDIVVNTATATIPAQDVLPPFVECYIILQNRSGGFETYPLNEGGDPFETPPARTIQIPVGAEPDNDGQVLFLSPEPGARVNRSELLISLSLLRADTIVVKKAVQILLDGADISEHAVVSGDIVVVSPENAGLMIKTGPHRLTVRLFDRMGVLHRSRTMVFTVVSGGGSNEAVQEPWRTRTSLQLESRHEDISGIGTWYNRGTITFNGAVSDWRFNANAFVTSDEKADRQPQDRFFVSAEVPWLRLGYGDSYPSFPNLILSGKRVRGLTSSLRLDWFNVDVALGKTTRAVEGALIGTFPTDSFAVEYAKDTLGGKTPPPYGKLDDQTWGKFNYGTYARDLFVIRPSFGSGEEWQWGFTWLKSKDDVNSVRYGIRPQENLVVGSDFMARMDDGGIELAAQAAFSAFNSDISSGTFTDANIDSIFHEESQRKDARDIRDILKQFITVNENLSPLSFKRLPTVAYDVSLALNYFDNVLKFGYVYRGSDYNSFGQTFLRKDIKGITITDLVRLAENRVHARAGIELLKDNTAGSKVATTSFTNFNIAVSYYPDPEYPNVTVGFSRYANKNPLSTTDTLNTFTAIDDATNRWFIQSAYDFDLVVHHTASLNISTSGRDDRSLRRNNVTNTTVGFGVATTYKIPLRTSIDVSINMNSLPSTLVAGARQDFDYTTLSFNARYAIIRDMLTLSATAAPTLGDFKRNAWDATVSWIAMTAMTVELQLSLYNNRGLTNDTIWSLRYRYDV